MKIYLVVNEKIISRTMYEFLININYDVLTLNSTSELLEILNSKTESQGLVIIEENTFRGEEKSIMKRIHTKFSNTFFIIIVTNTPEFTINEALSYGIYGYLHRPISLAELELLLIRFAGKRTK